MKLKNEGKGSVLQSFELMKKFFGNFLAANFTCFFAQLAKSGAFSSVGDIFTHRLTMFILTGSFGPAEAARLGTRES